MNRNVEDFKGILDKMAKTYEAKNNDYGSAIEILMREQGFSYIRAILGNKMLRLDTLTSGTTQMVKDESIADTLIDIAVYCIEAKRVLDKVANNEELLGRPEYEPFIPIAESKIDWSGGHTFEKVKECCEIASKLSENRGHDPFRDRDDRL